MVRFENLHRREILFSQCLTYSPWGTCMNTKYTHTQLHISHTHPYTHIIHIHTHTHVHMSAHNVHKHTHLCDIHPHTPPPNTYTHSLTHTHMHTHTHTHTHAHTPHSLPCMSGRKLTYWSISPDRRAKAILFTSRAPVTTSCMTKTRKVNDHMILLGQILMFVFQHPLTVEILIMNFINIVMARNIQLSQFLWINFKFWFSKC